MSKPYIHARSSARRFGGVPEDYMKIHELMDHSKSALADVRHRALFHSAYGIYIVQEIFGQTATNSDGKVYSVRDIAEQHVMEDLGFIPTLEQWMSGAPIEPWMMGKKTVKETRHISFPTIVNDGPSIPIEMVEPRTAEPAKLTPPFTRRFID